MHQPRFTTRPPRRVQPAFTLIELLVVIGIVVLLMAIVIPVAIGYNRGAKVGQTKAVLNALAAANDEFNIQTETTIDHTLVTNGGATDQTIGLFLVQASQLQDVENMFSSAAKSLLNNDINDNGTPYENVGDAAIYDPWQIGNPTPTPIRYAAKVDKSDTFTADDYLKAHPRPFFVSAGPDGLFGTVDNSNQPDPSDDANADGVADALDNIYSFDIDN